MEIDHNTQPIEDPIRHRPHRKLRISVTDRCNFTCTYCVPEDAPKYLARSAVLSFEEIASFVAKAAVPLGINRLRLTGGEPLLRRELPQLVKQLSEIDGIASLSLTTNAALLSKQAADLRQAGLQNINISLDTLSRDTNLSLTGTDHLEDVLRGIETARQQGFDSIKLNCVPIRGVNDGELGDVLRYGLERQLEVRFIEFMPFGSLWSPKHVITAQDLCGILEPEFGPIQSQPQQLGETAQIYILGDGRRFGVIPTLSTPFCGHCNRLRLTADGRLLPCLFSEDGVDVRALLREGDNGAGLRAAVAESLSRKGIGYLEEQQKKVGGGYQNLERDMRGIGG